MRKYFKLIALAITLSCSSQMNAQVDENIYKGIEFNMPRVKETSFKNYSVQITQFGAKAGGVFKNTEAINKAITETSNKGGGTVVIPRGIWLTGPIELKSNINLHLADGALLIFSKDFKDYPLVKTSFEGLNTIRTVSPISARNVENIAITGNGTIDGNGDAWRYVKKGKLTDSQWKNLVASGGVLSEDKKIWFPSESSKLGYKLSSNFNVPDKITEAEYEQVHDFLRPVMVSIVSSDRVLLDGPTFQNSPAWNIHPLMSSNIIIRNLNVRNPWYSQNGDGLDLESCKNVLIYNNTFDVGDDAICIKSGKDKDGRDRAMPTENVIIKNNTVYHAHGGFVIGSEMSSGVRNIHVSGATFIGTDIGLRFKTTRGRGGIIENIYISDVDMINIPAQAIGFNMFYEGNSPIIEDDQNADDEKRTEKAIPVTEETPQMRNIFFKNINVTSSHEALYISGLNEMNIKNIKIENSTFDTKKALSIVDADGVELKNVKFNYSDGTGATIYNSKNIDLNSVQFETTNDKSIVNVTGDKTSKVKLPKSVDKKRVNISKSVQKNAVQ
ncbi:Polygalacturonase [Chishuiella changwenlii]|uniref:Polygalacturonase n=2 Tax=Chishuiella changwenlii TaxID=1434701 RepID=A0A1M7C4U8_9FLAO|nr:glycoside hydrolase family 28 protein [Chishuiella changwenlii]SHL61869.1 Polygalacturonase [Chishuiella changwenlii]